MNKRPSIESQRGDVCSSDRPRLVGFAGLGHMGEPMARNLVRAQVPLMVWNRSERARIWFHENGVPVARTPDELFEKCSIIILMLANGAAVEDVLGRSAADLETRVAGRTIINMGTISPQCSERLEREIGAAGGNFVECPVSGSRLPAENGELVAMLAGDRDAVEEAAQLIAPMCSHAFRCGPVPQALMTKLAVNLFLITMVAGLVEATHFAQCHHLDLNQFSDIIGSGPMASQVSTAKLEKLARSDLSVQASLRDVLTNAELIAEAAKRASVASPLLDTCVGLFREAEGFGVGGCDMIAVLAAFETLTADKSVEGQHRVSPPGACPG